jgi:hypothetical protein
MTLDLRMTDRLESVYMQRGSGLAAAPNNRDRDLRRRGLWESPDEGCRVMADKGAFTHASNQLLGANKRLLTGGDLGRRQVAPEPSAVCTRHASPPPKPTDLLRN